MSWNKWSPLFIGHLTNVSHCVVGLEFAEIFEKLNFEVLASSISWQHCTSSEWRVFVFNACHDSQLLIAFSRIQSTARTAKIFSNLFYGPFVQVWFLVKLDNSSNRIKHAQNSWKSRESWDRVKWLICCFAWLVRLLANLSSKRHWIGWRLQRIFKLSRHLHF